MLEYVALGILMFAVITVFYGVIAIHDIPYEIAKHRNHPHQDALNIAGWVSLLTLHVLWPFLWIWATLYREDRGWGFTHESVGLNTNVTENASPNELLIDSSKDLFKDKVTELEQRINRLEQQLAAQAGDQ